MMMRNINKQFTYDHLQVFLSLVHIFSQWSQAHTHTVRSVHLSKMDCQLDKRTTNNSNNRTVNIVYDHDDDEDDDVQQKSGESQ